MFWCHQDMIRWRLWWTQIVCVIHLYRFVLLRHDSRRPWQTQSICVILTLGYLICWECLQPSKVTPRLVFIYLWNFGYRVKSCSQIARARPQPMSILLSLPHSVSWPHTASLSHNALIHWVTTPKGAGVIWRAIKLDTVMHTGTNVRFILSIVSLFRVTDILSWTSGALQAFC